MRIIPIGQIGEEIISVNIHEEQVIVVLQITMHLLVQQILTSNLFSKTHINSENEDKKKQELINEFEIKCSRNSAFNFETNMHSHFN